MRAIGTARSDGCVVARFETARTIVRAWRDDDVSAWVAMTTDPRVMEYFPSIPTRAEAEASAARLRERLEREGYGWWVVEHRERGAFAGVVALQEIPFESHFTPALEIGWRFAPAFWGCGYATEAARPLLEFAFAELARREVVSITAAVNLRSQRVMERLGMSRDPRDDFDHPRLAPGHRLRRHVLYRRAAPPAEAG